MMETQTLSRMGRIDPTRGCADDSPDAVSLASAMGEQALSACRNKVFCLCLGFIGNAADALDLTQDTFARALLHYHQDRPEHVQAWILRIARNICLDHLRRRKCRGPHHSVSEHTAIEWQTPEDHAGSQEDIRIVRKAIAQLPPRLREVLLMREYGELSYFEISRALDIGRGTVTSRLNRARQAIVRCYQEEHHERCHHRRSA
jgi:RNA polymerase sigma factor (sigma-70 family)